MPKRQHTERMQWLRTLSRSSLSTALSCCFFAPNKPFTESARSTSFCLSRTILPAPDGMYLCYIHIILQSSHLMSLSDNLLGKQDRTSNQKKAVRATTGGVAMVICREDFRRA